MKIFLLAAGAAALLLTSCGRSKTPDDVIHKIEISPDGYKPDPRGSNFKPIEVNDTTYTIAPTWGQSNSFAADRGDYAVWQVIGWILLLITIGLIYCIVADVSWFPRMSVIGSSALLFVVMAGCLISFKWQSASIRWNNYKPVQKTVYEKAMNEAGSTRPIWDSLETNCKITWGPYECYQ